MTIANAELPECLEEMPLVDAPAGNIDFHWHSLPAVMPPPGRRGSSFVISVLVHAGLIVLLAVVRFTPGIDERWKKYSQLALFAPKVTPAELPAKVTPAPRPVLAVPTRVFTPPSQTVPALTLPVPPAATPPRLAAREPSPAVIKPLPAPPAPAPPVQTGVFPASAPVTPAPGTAQPVVTTGTFNAPSTTTARVVDRTLAPTGAFGPATVVARAAEPPRAAQSAGFDVPAANATAPSRPASTLATAGFSAPSVTRPAATQGQAVAASPAFQIRTAAPEVAKPAPVRGGFGDAQVAQPGQAAPRRAAKVDSEVEILFKPRPEYTEEGRRRRLEGEVILEVVFGARGDVRVLRVVKGLGAGLDENAAAAAGQIRFKPAVEDGVPVDRTATARITFQLAY